MARTKPDLSSLTLNQLCKLTGKTYRTVKERLSKVIPIGNDGAEILYEPFAALPAIYAPRASPRQPDREPEYDEDGVLIDPGTRLDTYQERAKVDRQRWIKLELENQKRRGELLEISDVESAWAQMMGACRAKMLSLPSKLAPQLVSIKDPKKIQQMIKDECRQALEELHGHDFEQGSPGESGEEDDEDPGSATGPDGL
jgi:phage terminase Nu1 subunit (DNA packaging protein)